MSVRLSCPSCNTAFALGAIPEHRRAACPRCGDVFPVRGEVAESEDRGQTPEDRREPTAPPPAPPARRRELLFEWIIPVVIPLAVIGIGVGLLAYVLRQKILTTPPEQPVATTATPPAHLVGLGHLPADCNVVFAVQFGPLLTHAASSGQRPRELLTRAGVPAAAFAALDEIGLPLDQINYIAGGIPVGDDVLEPRITLVLVLRKPFADEGEFLKRLKAKPAPGGPDRYEVVLAKLPLRLARLGPAVWVFGLTDKDLSAVDNGGFGPGGKQFRGSDTEGFRKMLASVPPEAAVWVVADDERDWTQKPLLKLAAQSAEAKKWLPAASGGRGAVFAITAGEKPRMRLFVRTAEAAAAERVRAYFQARAAESASATAGGGGVFALYDAPFDPEAIQRFLADAAK